MPAKKVYAKRKATKRPIKKRTYRKKSNVPDMASLSVKRSMTTAQGTQFGSNTLYSLMNTQLLDYPRAVQVAAAYQHYRIKNIKLTIKPSYDTYQIIAGATTSKPNLYYMIDKSGSVPTNISLEGLKNMGARPKQLDEKNIVISWSPSVLESAMYAGGGPGAGSFSKYKISPWLTTSANTVSPGAFQASGLDHLGIYWYVDQLVNLAGAQYSVECEVQFQFKKPLTNLLSGTEATPAVAAELNHSPDGIVGGGDGI